MPVMDEAMYQTQIEIAQQQYEHEAISALRFVNTTKEHRQNLADLIVGQIREGQANPLEVHISLKALEDIIKRITSSEEYSAALLEEAAKYGKSFEMHNAAIQTKEAGTKWDYSQTNDSRYQQIAQQIDSLTAQRKEREKFLQTIPEGGMADPETGEMIYRAAKQSTTVISVTLK